MQDGYQATITRDSPACILFLLDVSNSMGDPYEPGFRRIDFLADAVNKTLLEIAAACKRQDGIRHYFDIGVFSYSHRRASSVLKGPLARDDVVSTTDLAANPIRVEQRQRKVPDQAGGVVEVSVPFPVWFDPQLEGGTSMCSALRRVAKAIGGWCEGHPRCFPPIVLHITDGEATDGGPTDVLEAARKVTENRTRDGYALLLNLHISGEGTPVRFPMEESALPPHPFARALFQASSALPPPLLARGFRLGLGVQPGSRGYVYNGRMDDVVAFFDIGTKAATDLTVAAASDR